MRRHIAAAAFAGLVGLMPVAPAAAQQDNTIGGAIAGGIIGAAAGAMLGSQLEPRAHGYYWYHDGCWRRWRNGSYHRVHRRYCY